MHDLFVVATGSVQPLPLYYFQFLFNWPVFPEITPGQAVSPEVFQRTFAYCQCKIC